MISEQTSNVCSGKFIVSYLLSLF